LDLMLSTWNSLHDTDKIKHQNLKIAYQLFKEISLVYPDYNQYKRLVFSLITCPFDVNSLLYLWRDYAYAILDNRKFHLSNYKFMNTLSELEYFYREIELYNHMKQIIYEDPNTEELMEEISAKIDEKILENKRRLKEKKKKSD